MRKIASPMKLALSTFVVSGGLSLFVLPAVLQAAEPDTTDWKCEKCPFPSGWDITLDAGSGLVTDDSYKFGDYRGLDDDGLYFIGAGDFRYWGPSDGYWEVLVRDLGLDSRSVAVSGGRQGQYRVNLSYAELPHRRFDTAETPFSANGSRLTLPDNWVATGNSRTLPGLTSALRSLGIGHDRNTLGLGVEFTPPGRFSYDVAFRHEDREGTGIRSGSFISQFSQLGEPIDYRSDEVDARISYVAPDGQVSLSYYGSWFANSNTVLRWDNPFAPLVTGADQGRMALPPDNQAHHVSLAGAWRWSDTTRLSGTLSRGSMTQDDMFTSYTVTRELNAALLPFASLNAEVDTTRLHLRAVTAPNPRLRLTVDYDYDDRDNNTPTALFQTIESDLYLATDPRINLPYSFKKQKFRGRANYRLGHGTRVSAGYEHDRIERDLQEVATTKEDSVWVKLKLPRTLGVGQGSIRLLRASRDGSDYRTPGDLGTLQNPLLRKFNMADRDRDMMTIDLPLSPHDRVDLNLNVATSSDDYKDSLLGLQDSDWFNVLLDGAVRIGEKWNLHASIGRERFESRMAGSQAYAEPDWLADTEDIIDSATFGVRWRGKDDKLDIGLDYVLSDSETEIGLDLAVGPDATFPNLETRLHSTVLYANYRIRDNLDVRASLYHERFRSDDWMLNNVGVNRLPSALLFGIDSPSYSVSVIGLSFTYRPRVGYKPAP